MVADMTIEALGPEHLGEAAAVSAVEGWPHRVEDWAFHLSHSRGVGAFDGDRLVGTAMVSPFGQVAMVNLVIVAKAARGQGLGRTLMERAMSLADAGEFRLVSTEAGQPLYGRLGFEQGHLILQHQGLVRHVGDPDLEVGPSDIDAMIALDTEATGMERAALIRHLVADGEAVMLRDGTGFAICRRFGRGEVVGPVVAPDRATAADLVRGFASRRPGAFLRVDTGESSGLSPVLEAMGLARVGSGLFMRRGSVTDLPGPTGFALVSQALG